MNQLITITQNENNDQVVSGRELHEFLEVKTPYHIWFERMAEYGFTENVDFIGFEQKSSKLGGRPSVDHALKIDMAKEISMIQRNEKGKQARQYFIEVEKELKQQLLPQTPEQQIALLAQGNVNLNKKVEQIEYKIGKNKNIKVKEKFCVILNDNEFLERLDFSKEEMENENIIEITTEIKIPRNVIFLENLAKKDRKKLSGKNIYLRYLPFSKKINLKKLLDERKIIYSDYSINDIL